jgi:hypothetical protein
MAAAPRADERMSARPAVTAVLVLAGDTWRVSWREVVVRTMLWALLVLAMVGAVAAVGSPTAGDAAIQMLAVAFMVVPFALVLVSGQVWRDPESEAAVFSRPVSAAAYVWGRILGLWAVGAAMLLAVDVVGSLALFVVAREPLGASLAWDTAWCALAVAPSVLLTAAAAVWLATRVNGGPRYFTIGILGALVVAFAEYKWAALASALSPVLALWSPYPGLLTLGLALPPELLNPSPAWLWANRTVWVMAAVLVATAATRRRAGGRLTPSRSPSRDLRVQQAAAVALGIALAWLVIAGAALSPATLSPARVAEAAAQRILPRGALQLSVTVNRDSGSLVGTAAMPVTAPAGPLSFWLNRGLQVTKATWNGTGVTVTHSGSRVWSGTAARLVSVSVPGGSGTLTVQYTGHLLPLATWLPTPPFRVGSTYEEAYAGGGRVYWGGSGSWYPRILAPGAGGTPLYFPVALSFTVTGPSRGFPVWSPTAAATAGPPPDTLWLEGPYHATVVDGVSVYSRRPITPLQTASLSTYTAALKLLAPWLPGGSTTLPAVVVNPLAIRATLTPLVLALAGNQPYCAPSDLVTGACGAQIPSSVTAWLRLAQMGWSNALGVSAGTMPMWQPAFPPGDVRAEILPVLAALTVIRADRGGALAARVAALGFQHPGALPVVGRLDATQQSELSRLTVWANTADASAWAGFVGRVLARADRGALTWATVNSAAVG